jgi:hypothetical protein
MKHDGKTYYFCCESCMKKFKENPKKYFGKAHGASHEECGEAAKTEKECSAETHGDEGCQKLIESGQCPHMKAKPAANTEKAEKAEKTEKAKKKR